MTTAQPQTVRNRHLPAPVGGVNAVDPASAMPPSDCVYVYNMIPDEHGLRAASGFREWCLGLTGGVDNTVRSVLPFFGSAKNGASDKLFAVTASGIWDCSAEDPAAAQLIAFPSSANQAGYGAYVQTTTIAGRFLVYTDEENGLYLYTESSDTWAKVSGDVTEQWGPQTLYEVGDSVVSDGNVYLCDTAGESDASSGPTGTGSNITDGTARWDYVGAALTSVIGPSLADQHNGFACDPADFVHVSMWGSRLWFTERDSSRVWYLDAGAIFGTATSFNFGGKARQGGSLVGLYNWSIGGGDGLNAYLVGITQGGDVIIYQGTDPSSASTFSLKGVWNVAGVVAGRRIANETGGDLLIISSLGVVPLSRLIIGGEVFDQKEYSTYKIGPVFVRLAQLYGQYNGWALVPHPTDNALMVIVPRGDGEASEQVARSFSTKGWFPWRHLPIVSAAVWNGDLYFGTQDGRVCRAVGDVAEVSLADPNDFEPVPWSVLPAFQNLGNANFKQVQFGQPVLITGTPEATADATAKYDFDITEPAAPTGTSDIQLGHVNDVYTQALWRFDESSGNTAADDANAQTFTSGATEPAIVSGRIGSARSFDGAATYMDATPASGVRAALSGAITVEGWVYLPADWASGNGNYHLNLFALARDYQTDPQLQFFVHLQKADYPPTGVVEVVRTLGFVWHLADNATEVAIRDSQIQLPTEEWVHYAWRRRFSGSEYEVALSINGVQRESWTGIGGSCVTGTTNHFRMGAIPSNGGGVPPFNYFKGWMDEHRVSSVWRTDDEIMSSYLGGSADSNAWDSGIWDSAVWTDRAVAQGIKGVAGMGRAVSVALRGNAISRTTLVGTNLWWTEGGSL